MFWFKKKEPKFTWEKTDHEEVYRMFEVDGTGECLRYVLHSPVDKLEPIVWTFTNKLNSEDVGFSNYSTRMQAMIQAEKSELAWRKRNAL